MKSVRRMSDGRRTSPSTAYHQPCTAPRTTPVARRDASLSSARQVFLILALLSTCCPVEGCWKRRSSPTTATVKSPESTTQTSLKLNCSSDETTAVNCLNGGVCFVIEAVSQRIPGCICMPEWVGRQCERRYVDPHYWATTELTACTTVGIVAGVFGLVISVVLAIIVAYLCHRHRRRTYDLKRQQQEVELAR